MTILTPAEDALLERDPGLSALRLVLDPDALASALDRLPVAPLGRPVVRRLRYKPGSSVVAAIEVRHGSSGSAAEWFMFAGYVRGSATKLAKDRRVAGRSSTIELHGDWILAPVTRDRTIRVGRALAGDVPDPDALRCMAYNPRRRLVLYDDRPLAGAESGRVLKVYASDARRLPGRVIRQLARGGVALPTPLPSPSRAVHAAPWTPGRAANPSTDAAAVAHVLGRLHITRLSALMPRWDRDNLGSRVERTAVAVADLLPTSGTAAIEVSNRLADLLPRTDLGPMGTLHGDFSPDQVLVADREVHLVDLDDCTAGPLAWDAATWVAAQAAIGAHRPIALPGIEPIPALVAAAFMLRTVEPFRRRQPAWERSTARLVDAAHAVLDGLDVSRLGVSA